MPNNSPLTIFGASCKSGTYLLLIELVEPCRIVFGNFRKGEMFSLSAGMYLYVGSALGNRSGYPLARRLIRHASRSGNNPPHAMRQTLLHYFSTTCNTTFTPSPKKLRWHVDYLLEQPEATLSEVVIIQSPLRLEYALATLLEAMQETSHIAPHLGAQDCRDSTHLLRLRNREALFTELQQAIPAMLENT
uniref:DUF123 domain-containing protein n=1 Tax=Chlorobium chlorochromatii (strain CaD3) TaxID=340177 RepID=Q3ARA2_CHLCH